ncbi:MAG: helix-turn-helix domain-containing protein [Armatimonadota bacterium]
MKTHYAEEVGPSRKLSIADGGRTITYCDADVELSALQARVFLVLARHAGRWLSADSLWTAGWGPQEDVRERRLSSVISEIRSAFRQAAATAPKPLPPLEIHNRPGDHLSPGLYSLMLATSQVQITDEQEND